MLKILIMVLATLSIASTALSQTDTEERIIYYLHEFSNPGDITRFNRYEIPLTDGVLDHILIYTIDNDESYARFIAYVDRDGPMPIWSEPKRLELREGEIVENITYDMDNVYLDVRTCCPEYMLQLSFQKEKFKTMMFSDTPLMVPREN